MTLARAARNIPNLLSGYRLAVIPVLVWAIAEGWRDLFFVLIGVSLVTDILDGWIARRFHLETVLGARLDTLADDATYITAFVGFVVLEADFVWSQRLGFFLLLLSNAAPLLVSLARFGRPSSLQLYSGEVAACVQGVLIVSYFVAGYSAWYFQLTVAVSLLACAERVLILLMVPERRSNARGLYWILAEERAV